MSYVNITLETKNKVAIVTVNRPDKLNALNSDTLEELHQAMHALNEDQAIRVVVVTGSGTKAFVAGADIEELSSLNVNEAAALSAGVQEKVMNFIENMRKPVIAAINGFALGGGLELALCCHFRVASDSARMGLPEVSLGIIPGYGGTQRLAQLIGKGRALKMICTAEMIKAEKALEYGLVSEVTAQEELLNTCFAIADKICQNSPNAIAEAIKSVNVGYDSGQQAGLNQEIISFGECFGSADSKEGIAAFLEKRKANF